MSDAVEMAFPQEAEEELKATRQHLVKRLMYDALLATAHQMSEMVSGVSLLRCTEKWSHHEQCVQCGTRCHDNTAGPCGWLRWGVERRDGGRV